MHVLGPSRIIAAGALIAGLALAGCGGGSDSSSSSTSASASSTTSSTTETTTTSEATPQFAVSIPGLLKANANTKVANVMPARYTCHGAGISPPLRWKNVPAGTKELALFILHTTKGGNNDSLDWSVVGLKPKLTGLEAGKLPPGAIVGRDGHKRPYSVCQLANKSYEYVAALYSVDHPLSAKPGFNAGAMFSRLASHTPKVVLVQFF